MTRSFLVFPVALLAMLLPGLWPMAASAGARLYPVPKAIAAMAARDVQVTVDGNPSFTYDLVRKDKVWQGIAVVASQMTAFELDGGAADIAVRYGETSAGRISVRRLGADVPFQTDGGAVHFRIDRPGAYQVEAGNDPRDRGVLVIFANAPDRWVSRPGDITFAPGTVNDISVLHLNRPGQRVHIPGGAVVRGLIKVETHDIAISGNGLLLYDDALDADPKINQLDDYSPLLATDADNLLLADLTVAVAPRHIRRADGDGPTAPWAVHILRSTGVNLQNLKIFNSVRDGLDIDGSAHVLVHGGYVQSLDDSVCIKSINYGGNSDARGRGVSDVRFEGMMVMNTGVGRALMIGPELHAGEISHVTYNNIDLLHALPPRAKAIAIVNGDRADVHDITYDDIRVLDRAGQLLSLTIETDGYKPDAERGQIHDVLLRRLQVPQSPGPSQIRGIAGHRIGAVTFETLQMGGRAARALPYLAVAYADSPQYH